MGGTSDFEDPLTPDERAMADLAVLDMLADDRAFVCGICGCLIDARYTDQHARHHDSHR